MRRVTTYGLWQCRVDITVGERKGQACPKAPATVKHVHTPKHTHCIATRVGVAEVVEEAPATVQAHFEGFSGSDANGTPRKKLVVAVEVVDALWRT